MPRPSLADKIWRFYRGRGRRRRSRRMIILLMFATLVGIAGAAVVVAVMTGRMVPKGAQHNADELEEPEE